MSSLQYYWVKAESSDGVNLDLIVVAHNKPHAKELWRAYFFDPEEDRVPAPSVKPFPAKAVGAVGWKGLLP